VGSVKAAAKEDSFPGRGARRLGARILLPLHAQPNRGLVQTVAFHESHHGFDTARGSLSETVNNLA
jgi:hypothetical protein